MDKRTRYNWRPCGTRLSNEAETAEELTARVVNAKSCLFDDRLLKIVGKLVARLPPDEVAEVLGIDPDDLEIVTDE